MTFLVALTILLAAEYGGASIYMWISLVVLPTVSGIVSWIVGKRQRTNDTLNQLQTTVDMLLKKNGDLYERITEQNRIISDLNDKNDELSSQLADVRRENAELKEGQEKMIAQLTALQRENAGLKKQLDAIKKGQQTLKK